ncbi:MAG: hypothetical protein Q8K75_03640 [Chlamydiales bacterium]|nr:hypothetical protein [Chlamydiales bacterium]
MEVGARIIQQQSSGVSQEPEVQSRSRSNSVRFSRELSPSQAESSEKVTKTLANVIADIKTPSFFKHVKHLFGKSPQIKAQTEGKRAEHKAVFDGFKTRLQTTQAKLKLDLSPEALKDGIKSDLKSPDLAQKKIERQIQQRFKAAGLPAPEGLDHASHAVAKHLANGNGISGDQLKGIMVAWSCTLPPDCDANKLAQTLSKEVMTGKDAEVDAHAKQLSKHMDKLTTLLNSDPSAKDAAKVNKEIMKELRSALESPAYLALKENENNPSVRVLHDLAVAGYLETTVMPGYEKLQEGLGQGGPQMPDKMSGKGIVNFFRDFRQHIHKNGIHKADMTNPFYLLTNFNSARQAFKSQKVGRGYDPRINAQNNSGAFFDEKAKVGTDTANLRHFFTPSWRVDSEIPPEARAALQSMTNRQNMKVDNDDHVAKQILYNNLQNINKSDESPSSINMMKLNDEFPDAFKGVTIPCDTSFHNRGLGHGGKMWENLYPEEGTERPTKMEKFHDDVFQKLMSPENFTLEGRLRDTGGYYLPGGQEKWREPLGEICAHLGEKYKVIQEQEPYDIISGKISNGEPLSNEEKIEWWHLESAMIEEANVAIRTLNEGMGLVDLHKANQPLNQAMTTVCKELADRGKNGSLENLYATSSTEGLEGETLKAFSSAKEIRPIMARNRVGLAHRDAAGNALFMLRSPQDLQETKNLALKLAMEAGGLNVNATVIPGATIVRTPGISK